MEQPIKLERQELWNKERIAGRGYTLHQADGNFILIFVVRGAGELSD